MGEETSVEPSVVRLALGLRDYLAGFASKHRAKTWKEFARVSPDDWKYFFLSLMDEPSIEVFFNLRDVEIDEGILRAASGRGSTTDWELLMIREHPGWRPKIRWMDDEQVLANPFEDPI